MAVGFQKQGGFWGQALSSRIATKPPQRTPWILRAPSMRLGGNAFRLAWNILHPHQAEGHQLDLGESALLSKELANTPNKACPQSGRIVESREEWMNV
jgi:hypothetical protein